MSLLTWLQTFEFTASGGVAFYFLTCTLFVTLYALYAISKDVFNWFKKRIVTKKTS